MYSCFFSSESSIAKHETILIQWKEKVWFVRFCCISMSFHLYAHARYALICITFQLPNCHVAHQYTCLLTAYLYVTKLFWSLLSKLRSIWNKLLQRSLINCFYAGKLSKTLQYVLRYWYHLARQTCCAFYVRHRYSFSSCLLSKIQLRSWPFYLPASSVFIHTVWSFDFRWNRNGWVLQIHVQEKNADVENWLLVLVLSWH